MGKRVHQGNSIRFIPGEKNTPIPHTSNPDHSHSPSGDVLETYEERKKKKKEKKKSPTAVIQSLRWMKIKM